MLFVLKLNAAGTAIAYSTRLAETDYGYKIAIDSAGSAYVIGSTNSDNFPTTPGAFQRSRGGTAPTNFVTKLAPFDICLQDDGTSNSLQFDSTTGNYQFSNCGSILLSGTGTITRKGCLITLQVNGPDRRLLARVDTCLKSGSASIQLFAAGTSFTILDRNTADSTCVCSQ